MHQSARVLKWENVYLYEDKNDPSEELRLETKFPLPSRIIIAN